MHKMIKAPHTELCTVISDFDYHIRLARHSDISAAAEEYVIRCSKLGKRLREVGEWVLAESADDFLYLCRRVLKEHVALDLSDNRENDDDPSTSDKSSDWSSKRKLTTKKRFYAQQDELKENLDMFEVYVHKCTACDDYHLRYIDQRMLK